MNNAITLFQQMLSMGNNPQQVAQVTLFKQVMLTHKEF